jgi:AcrR family transcriptional regulator
MTDSAPPLSLSRPIPVAKADASHDQLLDAALSLFIECGLRRTSMDQVAQQAGVGRATLYRRFGDKDQLVQAVILRECQQQLALIEADLKAMDAIPEMLVEAFVLAVTRAHAHPLLVRLLRSEPETILPYLTTELPAVTSFARLYLAGQISKFQQAGQLAVRPAEPLAELLLRLMQSLVLSPQGVIDPSSDTSVRAFAREFLYPLLTRSSG